MRRTAIAAAWIAGATIPAVAAFMFVFGCCVLPFHAYIHKVMPLCRLATEVLSGQQSSQHSDGQQPLPAREKQEPVKRMATAVPRSVQLAASVSIHVAAQPANASAYRSFISLGALRCDQDVGLHLLAGTLLI